MTHVVLLLSTADTELLAARGSGALYRTANPARVEPAGLPALLDGVSVVVLRLLGGRRAWPEGVDALLASGLPVVLLGGEAAPDAELMAASTVPAGLVSEALAYLSAGGLDNLRELHRFLSDTVLLTGEGFAPPAATPEFGVHGVRPHDPARPTVGIVFYRAHELSGNTAFVDDLCTALEARGANALPVFCSSLRGADPALMTLLGRVGRAGGHGAGGRRHACGACCGRWRRGLMGRRSAGRAGRAGAAGAVPDQLARGLGGRRRRAVAMDAAMQVAIPEFDGRLVTVPFSFKEIGAGDDIPVYRADPERTARLAGLAVRHARLRRIPVAQRKLAVVLSSYPTKHSRVGNAVGLDTPASAVVLLGALRDAGYTVGEFPSDSDELIHTLIAAGGHDVEWLTEEQLAAAPARVRLADYRRWFAALPAALTDAVREHWGEPPGSLYVDGSDIVLASLRFGNVLLMIQPPRGFGENPVAIYHDPDLPPSHHYLAAYRWLEAREDQQGFGADAVLHLGKHGTLEWLPGKGLGLSAECAPDAVLGELPLVYPFIVNDPGEGTQAKRRGHAVVVDHLVPPMARADSYGEMAKLEQLLDEYATVQALDPAKLPALRARIWELVTTAQLHHDLHVESAPGEAEFDDFVLHIDGYLCEVKDVQIRDGLHVLGAAPAGEAQLNLVLAVLRATQVWGGSRALPGLRSALATWAALDEQALLANPGAPVPPVRRAPRLAELPAPSPPPRRANGTLGPDGIGRKCRSLGHGGGFGARRERLAAVAGGPAVTGADWVDVLEGVARELVGGVQARGWTGAAAVVREVLGEEVPGRRRGAGVRLRRGGAPAGPHHRRDQRRAARAGRRVRAGRPVRLADPRAGQRAAHRAQLLLRRPEGDPVAQRLGGRPRAGRLAAGPAPRRHRRLPAQRRADRVGHRGDAHPGRRPGRDPGADRLPAGVGRGVPAGHRLRDRPARRAGPAAHRRHGAHLRVLPGRVPARHRAAGRRDPGGGRARRAGRAELPARPRRGGHRLRTATGGGPRRGSSAPSRAPTGPGCCR